MTTLSADAQGATCVIRKAKNISYESATSANRFLVGMMSHQTLFLWSDATSVRLFLAVR